VGPKGLLTILQLKLKNYKIGSIQQEYGDNTLTIEYTYDYDPGVRYHPDGSGTPPYTEIEIERVLICNTGKDVDITDFIFECCDSIIPLWEEDICEHEREREYDE